MKLLIVEYITPKGHVGYNSYHLAVLSRLYKDCTFISSSKHIEECNATYINTFSFPQWMCNKKRTRFNAIVERIFGICKLFYLKRIVKKESYDVVIFLTYDIMSLFVFRSSKRILLCNHNNLTDFNFALKRFLHYHLPPNYEYIVLAPFIKKFLVKYIKEEKIHYVPHGLTRSYPTGAGTQLEHSRYLLCSATSSCDIKLLADIINNKAVKSFFEEKGISMFIKTKDSLPKDDWYTILDSYIDEEKYNSLMVNAVAVFIPYDKISFSGRVSAVMMECIASNIPVLSSKIMATEDFCHFFNYNYLVDDPYSFVNALQSVLSVKDKHFYKNTEELDSKPYWQSIIG